MREFWLYLRRAFYNSMVDGCLGFAKGAAYSGLLSLFPLLSTIATLLVQLNAEAVSNYLSKFVFEVAPPGTSEMIAHAFTFRGQRPVALLVVASFLSVWAAGSLMLSLMEGFRAAYRLPTGRPIVRERLVAMGLVFAAALPAVGASALILFGGRVEQNALWWLGLTPGNTASWLSGMVPLLGLLLRFLVSILTVVLVAAVVYYVAPNRPMQWRNVWPGAWLATACWALVTVAFSWYVRNLANYNVLYGSVGGVIALLVWMYLLAVIALFGCEYNAERERVKRHQTRASAAA